MNRVGILREAIRHFLVLEQDDNAEDVGGEAAAVTSHLDDVKTYITNNESAIREILDTLDTLGTFPIDKLGNLALSTRPTLKATLNDLATIDQRYRKDLPFGIIMFGIACQTSDLDNIMFSIRSIIDVIKGQINESLLSEARGQVTSAVSGRILAWWRGLGKNSKIYADAENYFLDVINTAALETAAKKHLSEKPLDFGKFKGPDGRGFRALENGRPVGNSVSLGEALRDHLEINSNVSEILGKMREQGMSEIGDILVALGNKDVTLKNIKSIPDATPGKTEVVSSLEKILDDISLDDNVLADIFVASMRRTITKRFPSVRASLPTASTAAIAASGLTLLDLTSELFIQPVIPKEALEYTNAAAINNAESIEAIADIAGDYYDLTTLQSALIGLADAVRESRPESISPNIQIKLSLIKTATEKK
jgi:hypothetical protein